MAEQDRSFLHSRMLDPLDSPGPIPVEYSRQSQSLTADILETNRLAGLHPTTAWRPEIQTSQARSALLTSEEFHLMSRFSFQPNSMPNTAQRSFLTGLQGSVSDRHILEMANGMRQAQQEENRPLQAPQLRVDTPHVQNNGNQFPLQGRHSLPFTMGQQAEARQIYQTSQPQPHTQIQSMGQDMQRSISQQGLQQSESRPSTSESRKARPSVKHLTCWWWNEKGKCKYTVDECLYAHHKTGRVADAPRQVKAGEPPVAGRKLMRALREEAEERAKRAPEREMSILQAQNKALREAYTALSSTTSQSLSAISTLRQSLTRLTVEVGNVERGHAGLLPHSTTPEYGKYQVDSQLARVLRVVEDEGLLAGVGERQTRAQAVRVEASLVAVGLGELVEDGKRRAVTSRGW
ncbi:predicted protein [Histoplasma capsulatum var. duboisii H88]|uniref:Predicted protein n=1 Tax=Ajellomyces capsulatus (strain H88) TaxID=544711 RepID=F0UEV1_AJEC8|nr:predicted protein [Histoplasma capsulatum var. duboisii H88]